MKFQNEAIQEHCKKLSSVCDMGEKTFSSFTDGLPRYRHKLEKLRTACEERDDLIQAEKNAKDHYVKCTEAISLMIKSLSVEDFEASANRSDFYR